MPKELFKLEWLINSDLFEDYAESYTNALSELKSAKCEVERLEAEDWLEEKLNDLKVFISSYIDLDDEELNAFISTLV